MSVLLYTEDAPLLTDVHSFLVANRQKLVAARPDSSPMPPDPIGQVAVLWFARELSGVSGLDAGLGFLWSVQVLGAWCDRPGCASTEWIDLYDRAIASLERHLRALAFLAA